MIKTKLVIKEFPVCLTLDVLTSSSQCDWSLIEEVFLRLGTQFCSPVNEGSLQGTNTTFGQGLRGKQEYSVKPGLKL